MELNENIMQMPYGVFAGIGSVGYYESGQVKEIRLNEKNVILTHAGELIPFYSEDTPRRKYKASVKFFSDGTIKSVSLDEQQEIITPIGEFPAELVTFYSTGELKRFFPLDGKISGFWSEEEERGLNIPFSFEFGFTTFTALLVGVSFFKSGNIKSITLFPGEVIKITAGNYGVFSVKNGFSLFESGELSSFEPAEPSIISTPIGDITAFDVNSTGINADSNSVSFDTKGRLISLVTSGDKIAVKDENGVMKYFAPQHIQDPLSENNEEEIITVKLQFDYENNKVKITNGNSYSFLIKECYFQIYRGSTTNCSSADCANCSLCQNKN